MDLGIDIEVFQKGLNRFEKVSEQIMSTGVLDGLLYVDVTYIRT
jgi:hypothetical protein